MSRLFISYAREDDTAITTLEADLRSLHHEPWRDSALLGGAHWWPITLENIENCDIFIFAVSAYSVPSRYCRTELAYAARLGKPMIPVLVRKTEPSRLPPELVDLNWVDYSAPRRESLASLVVSIGACPPAPHIDEPHSLRPENPSAVLIGLNQQISSEGVLSQPVQLEIVESLRTWLRDVDLRPEVISLTQQFRDRPDLFARTRDEIDELVSEASSRPGWQSKAKSGPQTRPNWQVKPPRSPAEPAAPVEGQRWSAGVLMALYASTIFWGIPPIIVGLRNRKKPGRRVQAHWLIAVGVTFLVIVVLVAIVTNSANNNTGG